MRLRYRGTCSTCGTVLEAGVRAWWDAEARVVYCLSHAPVAHPSSPTGAEAPSPPPSPTSPADTATVQGPTSATPGTPSSERTEPSSSPAAAATSSGEISVAPTPAPDPARATFDPGVAGGSAKREYERRAAGHRDRVRARHPRIGGALLWWYGDPQSVTAWSHGAVGEKVVGARLAELAPQVLAVHDRRIPGSPANIDHIAVGPSGVFVIDAKYRQTGKVEVLRTGSIFRPGPPRLVVGGRNCMSLVQNMPRQVETVRRTLAQMAQAPEVPVRPVLAFVNAEWGLFAKPFEIEGVVVAWPRAMMTLVAAPGPLDPSAVYSVAAHLAERLRPA